MRHKLLIQANVFIKQGQWKNDDAEEFKKAVLILLNKGIQSTTAYWR